MLGENLMDRLLFLPVLLLGLLVGSPAFSADFQKAEDDEYGEARRPYSTVTLFARLRGWSTSVPLMTAT